MAVSTALTVNDIVETQVVCTAPSQVAVHVLYHKVLIILGTPPVTTLDVAKNLDGVLAPLLKAAMAPYGRYYGVQSRIFFPVNQDRWAVSTSHIGPGTVTGDPLPTQTCGLLRISGEVWGRAGSGRWYLPFPSSAHNDTTGTPLVAYLNAGDNIGTVVGNDINLVSDPVGGTAVMRPVLVNRATKVTNFVTATRTLDAWATQKSRGSFGRLNTPPF